MEWDEILGSRDFLKGKESLCDEILTEGTLQKWWIIGIILTNFLN